MTIFESEAAPEQAELGLIWAELLGAAPATETEDFFAAGGDSIGAAALVARVIDRFAADVSLEAFLSDPTPAALLALVADAAPAPADSRPVEADGPAPCSYAQERFWFIDQASGSNVVSNVSWALRLRGSLEPTRLEQALADVVARHDTLRSRFEVQGDKPVQLVQAQATVPLELAEAANEAEATTLAAQAAQIPFDLTAGPLLRAQLLRLGPEDHVLHFVAHHIICDDWTKGVILSELGLLYEGLAEPEPPGLQYPAYARRQREVLDEKALSAELAHWQQTLAGVPGTLELPADRPRPPAPSLRGARLRTAVDPELARSLRALGREHGATFFMTMLAGLEALLWRYTGQEEFVVGTAIDNRGTVGLERAVGLYTNVLALRADLTGTPSFRELLARARTYTLGAMAHQHLPFDRLAAATRDRDASRHPVFQIFYEFIVPAPLELRISGVRSEPFDVPKLTSEFDLGLYLDEQRGGLDAVWEYSTDLFEPATIERLARHFLVLLAAVAAEPDRPVGEIELLDEAERRLAIEGWNATAEPLPQATIDQLFEERARRAPGAPALLAAGSEVSYGELNARANRFAHWLGSLGVGGGDCVGLSLGRTVDLVAAMLGILKAGAAYVPLNPDHPTARLLAQLETAGARVLVAEEALPGFEGRLLRPDDDRLASFASTDPARSHGPEGLAYVLFTSGSTGVPKGVEVTHRNLVNYTLHMLRTLGEGGEFGSVSAVSTDLGNTAIFPALAGGGCLHLIPSDAATDAALFAAYVAEHPLDVLKITPSHLGSLLDTSADRSLLPRRWLVLGGEALTWELAQRVCVAGGPRVMNHYGPTEATVGCCTYELAADAPRAAAATVPIGRPISNATAYVLDARRAPVPVGVSGELYIGGAGVARGYAGAPDLTAERFVPDPFGPGRLYRTGDLVRRLPDGAIEFLGRADEQVKIRGFRVEPAEVQAVLLRQPGVRQAAVIASGEGEAKRLLAYVVGTADIDSVRAELERTLPSYMIPSSIAGLERLPLTPNGKLDRSALPRPKDSEPAHPPGRSDSGGEPASEQEAALAAIWSDLLGCTVSPGDNFFDLGGHSLLAIRLIARIRKELGSKLALKALIDAPTVRELAAKIAAQSGAAPAPPPVAPAAPEPADTQSIPRVPRDRPLRCSFVQEQLWLVDQLTPGSAAYNFSWPMLITGPLDREALSGAVSEFVRRHEALRTRFAAHDGQPLQIIEQSAPAALEVVDLTDAPEPQAEAKRRVDEYTAQAFDLARGPLLRAYLLVLGAQEHILQIVVHHIVFDGVSKVVLYRELGQLYDAFAAGRASPFEPPRVQYADFAEWQRTELDGARLEQELAHWRDTLAGAPAALEIPTDRPRPAVASLRGARLRVPLPARLREDLENLARERRATFFNVMLAAFDLLLYRYTGQADLVVGTPVDTRSRPELAEVIGPFINTVVIRTDMSGSPSFGELLARVQAGTLDAVEHQELPFERLVAALTPERDLSRHPIFQALIALNPPESGLALPGLASQDIDPAWTASRVDLFLVLDDLPHGMEAIWEFSTDLFDAETIERMGAHFVRLLEEVVAGPERPIDELPLLTGNERGRLLEDWNGTVQAIPDVRLERLIAEQAARTPGRAAVQFDERSLTYAELDARANQLAHRLRALGAGPGELVGICLERSEQLPVALLATLKTGAAYVPIDPAFPTARQAFMLADAQARVLVTSEDRLSSLPEHDAHVLCLDRDSAAIDSEPVTPPEVTSDASDLAYVIYTSGSTGTPKGVEIEHRALVNFLSTMRERPGLADTDVLVAVTTLSFDIAGLELYLPLIAGARVVIASASTAADPRALARLLERTRATVMQATPTTWRMLLDAGWRGQPGLRALCGGEALPPHLADELVGCGLELWNMYGPTETTIWSSCARIEHPGEPLTIGRPIANTTLYVVDGRGDPAPIGVPGELLIGGAGLARGYRGRPELTAERFVPNPFGEGRVYRTGDLARYRGDGTIQFLGRLDQQIKLRGYRIELGEIEATLARHPAVTEAAATVQTVGGEPALVGYVVGGADGEELRRLLAEQLPAYMVPAAVVPLERMPLTPNGKLDRLALPAPEPVGADQEEFAEPSTETERAVASLFAEVLGAERIGARADFFALGGQSLLAARLISRLDAKFDTELPLRALFEAPTVAALAARIDVARGAGDADYPEAAIPAPAVPSEDAPPPLLPVARVREASFAQERFWFIDQVSSESAAYNISWPVRLRGALDALALERALNEIVRRHEILRSRFTLEDGRPAQVIEPGGSIRLHFLDLTSSADPEREIRRIVDEQTQAPFDLERGPVLRAMLLRAGEGDHVLQVVVHHIAADGWSKVIFFRELGVLYAAYAENRPAALAELPLQYSDFAQWQRSWQQGERLERELGFWSEQLAGMPSALELPTDRPRPQVATLRGGWWHTSIPAATYTRLQELGRSEGATLFMVMLSAFDVLLYRYSGQTDVVVGAPVDTRGRPELELPIGPFVNTIVTRNDLSGSPSFRELVARVRRRTLEVIEHQDVPFERLVERLAPSRDLGRHPLFQVLITLNPPEPGVELAGLETEEIETAKTTSRVDLTLLLQQRGDDLDAIWEYSSDLFDEATVARIGRHFLELLDSIVESPDDPIDDLTMVPEPELRQMVTGWNQTRADYPHRCLHELVSEQAARTPDAVAVESGGTSLSYRELDARASQLAWHLRDLGVGPEVLVGISVERSVEMMVGLLGILRAGGAYVPIDPAYPRERQAFMLEASNAPVLVTEERLVGSLPLEGGAQVVCLDRDWGEVQTRPTHAPQDAVDPEQLAYVIYTSGSTGQPKGVQISHRALVNFLSTMRERPGLAAGDVLVAVTTLSFDIAGLELYLPLITGARLVIASTQTASDPRALAALIERSAATVMQATPTTWRMLLEDGWPGVPGLKALCGGEALPVALAERLLQTGVELWNMYGPTETTIWSTCARIESTEGGLTIGRPIANTTLYVLDQHLRPVPVGVVGELWIGGDGLARGYRGRDDLTAERFLPSPFGDGRIYRTGDLARYRADGEVEFLGRVDHQVKVRGYRIELGEIETALSRHDAVADAVAMAHEVAPGDVRLAAYVVPSPGADTGPLASQLRDWLRRTLPEYMVPATITLLEAMPQTANGKVDRKALPAPVEDRSARVLVAPSTPAQRELAELWSELLGVEQVGGQDDFFELGGHSLLAVQLTARILARFEIDLPVRAVFEEPTLAGLAAMIENPSVNGDTAPVRISPRKPGESWPLGYSQQQLWLLDQWDSGAPTYNVALPFRLRGPVDFDALRRALTGLLERHEALRTVIEVRQDAPVPVLIEDPAVELGVIPMPGAGAEEIIDRLTELSRRPFDFSRDALLRASVLSISEDDHVLLLETHHIAFDGWSEVVLLEELAALYQGQTLAPLPLQFGDFASWQRRWLAGEDVERELDWWRRHLAGAPTTIELPADSPRPDGRRFNGATHDIAVASDIAVAARSLCRRESATPYMLGLAVLSTLLYRVTGQDDILIGSPVANRGSVELERVIGFVSNTLVFRARLDGDPTFRELLARVREMALGVYSHQAVPFEKIVEVVAPERQPGVNPLFQVNLRVNAVRRPVLELGQLRGERLRVDSGLARFDLALDLDLLEGESAGYFRYNRDIFDPATITRLADEFTRFMAVAVTEPERRLLSFEPEHDWSPRRPVRSIGGLRGFRARGRENQG